MSEASVCTLFLPFRFCLIQAKNRFQSLIHKAKKAPMVLAEAIPTGHPGRPQKGQTAKAAYNPVNPNHQPANLNRWPNGESLFLQDPFLDI
jgi:hypothetical protein